jgi:hypothetical protein
MIHLRKENLPGYACRVKGDGQEAIGSGEDEGMGWRREGVNSMHHDKTHWRVGV